MRSIRCVVVSHGCYVGLVDANFRKSADPSSQPANFDEWMSYVMGTFASIVIKSRFAICRISIVSSHESHCHCCHPCQPTSSLSSLQAKASPRCLCDPTTSRSGPYPPPTCSGSGWAIVPSLLTSRAACVTSCADVELRLPRPPSTSPRYSRDTIEPGKPGTVTLTW
jgi:hypothetical protein